ncbi:meiosis inhibitor protein 1 [Lepisosteus oculatus]|uniref:meiosis inhibitor protein 1 n=1 Tax=Lepisosteus oculatus TaxID=7918 RepID=UPI0035F514CE
MAEVDVVYEKTHHRHDPRWAARVGPADGGVALCVACVVELLGDADVSVVRKSHALCCLRRAVARFPAATCQLLLQEEGACTLVAGTLLEMLHTVADAAALEQVIEVLVQLLAELKSEQFLGFVLDRCDRQLTSTASLRGSLPTLTFLGKLMGAVPTLAETLAADHGSLLEQLCAGLLFPDEAVKASVCYLYGRLWSCGAAVERLPAALRDRLCRLLLSALSHAQSRELHINCLGLLKQLLRFSDAVSVLMSWPSPEHTADSSAGLNKRDSSLPLIFKKLLLSGDETLQVASSQCMAAVLVHAPCQYAPQLIQADIPEFLFERLSCTSELLLWSVYRCLRLLTEDALFFSKCHAVYGIEPLIRSLKEALQLNNQEIQREGLVLLTEILDRQPASIQLFSSCSAFREAAEAVRMGVSVSSLEVATQAACAAAVLLRLNHMATPVQYRELQGVIEAAMRRVADLPWPSAAPRRACPSGQACSAEEFLLQSLVTVHTACRLAEQCAGEPSLKENAFTAPGGPSEDTLDTFSLFLLETCGAVCIPAVTSLCERGPSAAVLQVFFSILSAQYTLVPSMMHQFSARLASCSFFKLTVELKAAFCSGQRNTPVNAACSELLQRMCLCLLSDQDTAETAQQDLQQVGRVLARSLPGLCARLSEWPDLLREDPGPAGTARQGLRAAQYTLLLLLHLALLHRDRLLPDEALFPAVVTLLGSLQDRGDCPPAWALRAALFLLSATQDRSPALDGASVHAIRKALSAAPTFSSLYTHHPAVLHFLFRYSELTEQFGLPALESWLGQAPGPPAEDAGPGSPGPPGPEPQQGGSHAALFAVIESSPTAALTLLGVVCTGEAKLAHNALLVLTAYLQGCDGRDTLASDLLRPRMLQILQCLSIESDPQILGAHRPLSLVLRLLCLTRAAGGSAGRDLDSTAVKLLYHVSNLAGKLTSCSTEVLQPAFNYMYLCLALSPDTCTNKAVSVLLCNTGLMELLQATLELPPGPPSASPLLCCACLLLNSLLRLQHTHSAQVHKSITLDLDRILLLLGFRKQKTDSLLLACFLQLLQTALDQDFLSPLLTLSLAEQRERPLEETEAALYPLGLSRARCLMAALHSLLLQRQELLLSAAVGCLDSLLHFLHRRSPPTALHAVSQPWTRFLLYTLLSSGESCLLHPALLTLLTLLLKHGSTNVVWQPDLARIFEAVERRGVRELGDCTAQALTGLIIQVHTLSHTHTHTGVRELGDCTAQALTGLIIQVHTLTHTHSHTHRSEGAGRLYCTGSDRPDNTGSPQPPGPKEQQAVRSLLETLQALAPSQSSHRETLCVGGVSVCLSHFQVKTRAR